MRLQLGEQFLLVHYGLFSLLIGAFDAAVHPVSVVTGGLDITVLELLLDVHPDFTVLEVGVQLNDLHVLLLIWLKFVQVESYPEECSKHACSHVVSFDKTVEKSIHIRVVLLLLCVEFGGSVQSQTQHSGSF